MEPNLLRVAVLAMAGIVTAGLLVAVRDAPIDRVVVRVPGLDPAPVSAPILVSCIVLQVVAWSLLLAGAMHAHWPLRATILTVWSLGMLAVVHGVAGSYVPAHDSRSPLAVYLVLAGTLLVVLLVWEVAIAAWLLDRFHAGWAGRTHRHRLNLATGAASLVATALVYGLGWLAYPTPTELATTAVEQGNYLATFMIVVLLVSSSDFTEWAEVVAGRASIILARRRPALLVGGAGLASLALVVNGLRTDSDPRSLALGALEMIVLVGVALGLGRLLLVSRQPGDLPLLTLTWTVVVAILPWAGSYLVLGTAGALLSDLSLFAALVGSPLAASLTNAAGALVNLSPQHLPSLAFLALQASSVPAAAALVLLARRSARLATPACFFAVLCTGFLCQVSINVVLGHGNGLTLPRAISVAPALACLGLVAWLVTMGRWSGRDLALLRLVLVLALGTQFLEWLIAGFRDVAAYGGNLSPVQGLLLVAAMCWDVALSGSTVTNRDGPRVPRHSRVLMYFGYTLLASSAIALWSLIGFSSLGVGDDTWVSDGLTILGPPLLVTYFTFGVVRVWQREASEVVRTDADRPASRP